MRRIFLEYRAIQSRAIDVVVFDDEVIRVDASWSIAEMRNLLVGLRQTPCGSNRHSDVDVVFHPLKASLYIPTRFRR